MSIPTIVVRRILKHFCGVHDSRKRVVGFDNSCRRPVVSLSHATKSYRVNRPLQYNRLANDERTDTNKQTHKNIKHSKKPRKLSKVIETK